MKDFVAGSTPQNRLSILLHAYADQTACSSVPDRVAIAHQDQITDHIDALSRKTPTKGIVLQSPARFNNDDRSTSQRNRYHGPCGRNPIIIAEDGLEAGQWQLFTMIGHSTSFLVDIEMAVGILTLPQARSFLQVWTLLWDICIHIVGSAPFSIPISAMRNIYVVITFNILIALLAGLYSAFQISFPPFANAMLILAPLVSMLINWGADRGVGLVNRAGEKERIEGRIRALIDRIAINTVREGILALQPVQ